MIEAIHTPVRFSELIDRAAQGTQNEIRKSTLGHHEALEELWEVWEECRHANWDGYDALPVEQETYHRAYTLIESLPLGFPRPSVGAEPDGHLTLEWYKSQRRTLSISVDPDGFLHYAGLFGPSKKFGTLVFFGTAPNELIQLVREI